MIRRTPLAVAVLASLFGLSVFLAPAARAQEILMTIDAHGKLDRIDQRLEHRIARFPDYPDFREARLFMLADSSYVLES